MSESLCVLAHYTIMKIQLELAFILKLLHDDTTTYGSKVSRHFATNKLKSNFSWKNSFKILEKNENVLDNRRYSDAQSITFLQQWKFITIAMDVRQQECTQWLCMLFGEDKHVDFVLEGEMTNLRIVPIHPFSSKRSFNIINTFKYK